MRLSIIIPVFNAGAYLLPLLASLRQLPGEDIEFIAVDDGSTDHSPATLFAHAARDSRFWVIQQTNAGVAVARNRGLQAARGEYIWFVDADDLPVADALAALMAATRLRPDVIAFNGERFGDGKGADVTRRERIYQAPKPAAPVSGVQWLATLLGQKELRHFVWLHWCRREYLRAIGLAFLPGILHEDVAWVTEILARAGTLQYADVIGYHYRMNTASVTGSRDDAGLMRRIHSYFTVVTQLRELNQRMVETNARRPELAGMLQGEVVGQALQVFELSKQLSSAAARAEVMQSCRSRRFAQSLWDDAPNFKRKRQVVAMWLQQQLG